MDWKCYKQRCDSPEMWSRWMLNETIGLVGAQSSFGLTLEAAMRATPLEKPLDHRGGPATDMFELDLGASEVDAIVLEIEQAAQRNATTSGGRGLGGFVEAWQEYQRQVSNDQNQT